MLIEEADSADILHAKGLSSAEEGDLLAARDYLLEAVSRAPNNALFNNNLGNVYKLLRDYDQAIAAYQRAIALQPDIAVPYNNLGTVYYLLQQYDQALKAYYQALQREPAYVAAHENAGILFLSQQQFSEAMKQFHNVIALNENAIYANYQLGNLYLREEKWDEAETYFLKTVALDNSHCDALNNLGVICLKKEKSQDAIQYFTEVLLIDNDNLQAINNMAATFIQHCRYENALTYYQRYLTIKSGESEIHYNCGVAFSALGQIESAKNQFSLALKADPHHRAAMINMAIIALREGNKTESIHLLNQALAIDPQCAHTQHMLQALTGKTLEKMAPASYAKDLFDHYALHYDQHLQGVLGYALPKKCHEFFHRQVKDFQRIKRLLDLGCGTGLAGACFQHEADNLIGIDISPAMLAIAEKKQIYHQLIEKDILSALKDNRDRFDLIIAADVFGYVGDLVEIIEHIYRALEPKGYLLFTVELTDIQPYILQESIRYAYHQDYLREIAKTQGFTLIAMEQDVVRQENHQPLIQQLCLLQRAI